MASENTQRFRILSGPALFIEKFLGTTIPLTGMFFILDIPLYLFNVSLFNQQYLGLFLGLVMTLLFVILPASPAAKWTQVPWYDWFYAILSLGIGLYVLIYYPVLAPAMGIITTQKLILGIIALLLILEGTRRIAGWPLVIIITGFILYARFGYLLPGVLSSPPFSWSRVINQLFLGSESIYGIALRTAALVVFAFIIFAHTLFGTGGAEFLFKLAESLMGRFRGGPAKVSILASSFFGTISGSAVANVAGTGTITIPLMKKTGYPPHFACAVEAVASTGGTIMPPIMGATAFLIAEFLGVPYSQVVLVAIIPAILFYLGLFIQVDLRAGKESLQGLPAERLPLLKQTLLDGWMYLVPLVILIYCLFALYLRPEVSVLYALASLIILTFIRKGSRGSLHFANILQSTSRGMLEITVICAAAGIVIGVVNYTGLGFSLSRFLITMAGENLFLLAILAAAVSIILGMGVPALVSYMILAVLVAPAFIHLGVPPIVAHLFIFYFGTLSFITPPVCLATYTAASIGGAGLMQTAFQAMKLAVAGYIVPFAFIFNPAVMIIGEGGEIAIAIASTVAAIISLSIALEGYLLQELGWAKRGYYVLAAISLIIPSHWMLRVGGAIILGILIIIEFSTVQKDAGETIKN